MRIQLLTHAFTKVRAQHFDPIQGKLSAVDLVPASGKQYLALVVTLDVANVAERSHAREAREAILKRLSVTRAEPPTVRDLASAAGISTAAASRHLQHPAGAKSALTAKDPFDDRYTLTEQGEARARALIEQSREGYENAHDPG
jgi:hypothetical protein